MKMNLRLLNKAQRKQFIDFENAWDSYMMEYEDIAHKSILKLQKQQEGEVKKYK